MTPHSPASPSFAAALQRNADALELVERALQEQLASNSELVGVLGEHVLGSGGKRMRPALLLLVAELCGYTGPRRIHMGAAIELLHTATLLHDDVVDFSEKRRGRPSANALWGNRRAVLAGDFFYSRASAMIVEDGDQDILFVFAETIKNMAEGELLQLARSFDPTVTESHYFSVIDQKSAVLLKASCEVGAIVGGVTRAETRKLAEFGRELGMAFQLRDDALDYEAGETALGKRLHDDLREGKITLPLLLALKRCTPAERDAIGLVLKSAAHLAEVVEPQAVLDLEPAIAAVRRYRGVEDTVRRAQERAKRASEAIAPFPDCLAKRDLLAAAEFSVSRDR